MTATDFADALHAYCTALDASVTSWGRTRRHNQRVGGVERSQHLTWTAADVVYDFPATIESRQHAADVLGLLLIPEGDHDHLQARHVGPE